MLGFMGRGTSLGNTSSIAVEYAVEIEWNEGCRWTSDRLSKNMGFSLPRVIFGTSGNWELVMCVDLFCK